MPTLMFVSPPPPPPSPVVSDWAREERGKRSAIEGGRRRGRQSTKKRRLENDKCSSSSSRGKGERDKKKERERPLASSFCLSTHTIHYNGHKRRWMLPAVLWLWRCPRGERPVPSWGKGRPRWRWRRRGLAEVDAGDYRRHRGGG